MLSIGKGVRITAQAVVIVLLIAVVIGVLVMVGYGIYAYIYWGAWLWLQVLEVLATTPVASCLLVVFFVGRVLLTLADENDPELAEAMNRTIMLFYIGCSMPIIGGIVADVDFTNALVVWGGGAVFIALLLGAHLCAASRPTRREMAVSFYKQGMMFLAMVTVIPLFVFIFGANSSDEDEE